MRLLRFWIVALLVVCVYCGAIAVRIFFWTPAAPRPLQPSYPVTDNDIESAKSYLCRMARGERAFYAATGHFAEDAEIRADNSGLLPNPTPPYSYSTHVPVADRFVIVAHAYGPLQKEPPALLVDDRLQLCTVRSDLPNTVWQLDDPPQRWGRTSYDCAKCD